jgi:hypothetical protein
VLPERHLAERKPFLAILVLLLDEERVVLLGLRQLLFGLCLVLLAYCQAQVFSCSRQFLLELGVARRFL